MINDIKIFSQSSIKIAKIYFDPFKIDKYYNDAEYIFITHPHYDHFSISDINKVKNDKTKIIIPEELYSQVSSAFNIKNIYTVKPNEAYKVGSLNFATIPAYNINKDFHKKSNSWVGYIINLYDRTYYIAGDTDKTKENSKIKCDFAFVPIGGTYTMDYKEAAELINEIKPEAVIPTHYGSIVGNVKDGEKFKDLINPNIKCYLYIK